jgi:hypothetical protein
MADDEAAEPVPDARTLRQQFDQLKPWPHNRAALESASTWVPSPHPTRTRRPRSCRAIRPLRFARRIGYLALGKDPMLRN